MEVSENTKVNSGMIRHSFKRNKLNIILIATIFIIILCVSIYSKIFGNIETYIIVNGYVEKTSDTQGYIIKDESIASVSSDQVAIPVIEQGKKAAKGEIVAIYKDENYTKYLTEIEKMDEDIQSLIDDLPSTYSSDVKEIDNQMSELSKEAFKTTSYIEMQEYKNKLDELSYKKVLILGTLSPEGSKIRELIEEREEYEIKSKTSSNNIKAPMTGVVTYKIDGLEDTANIDDVFNYNISDMENIIQKYNNNDQNKFGIKIVDNYEAYILVKEEKGKNDEYIKEGKSYTVRLSEFSDTKISAKLVKVVENETHYYCIMQVNNGIENIADSRLTTINIIWKKVSGLAIPKHYISENTEKGYKYVTMILAREYVEVPIDISMESDNICIVTTMSEENLEKYNIELNAKLEIYDQIIYKER